MRRFLGFSLALVLGVVLGRFFTEAPVTAQVGGGAGPVASANGDINGDGRIDISDASALLNWLFLGDPGPVPCPGAGGCALPATGLTMCRNLDVEVGQNRKDVFIDCAEAGCPGQDGAYQAGCPTEGRFVETANTVIDKCTGFMWQRRTATVILNDNRLAWCDALKFCENLSLAGHDDWRLPNVRELQSIVDYSTERPAVSFQFDAESSSYWSSTIGSGGFAWSVNFLSGGTGASNNRSVFYVRAVRNLQ